MVQPKLTDQEKIAIQAILNDLEHAAYMRGFCEALGTQSDDKKTKTEWLERATAQIEIYQTKRGILALRLGC